MNKSTVRYPVIAEKDFQGIIKEYFDINDRDCRKKVLALESNDKSALLVSLSAKLYGMIKDKVADIDYNKIPESKGDITKIPNFIGMVECLDTIRGLAEHYRQSTSQIDEVYQAIENIKDSKTTWEKAFNIKCELPMVMYNTICLSIVSAVSLLISASIDFMQDPSNDSDFNYSFDKVGYVKTKNHLLFRNLKKFNIGYKKGDFVKCMEDLMKSQRAVKESNVIEESVAVAIIGGVIVGVSLLGLLRLIIPILQELVCYLYSARQSISDWFYLQSALITSNAEMLKATNQSVGDTKKVYAKQIKIAKKMASISNKLNLDMKKDEKQAMDMSNDMMKEKHTVDNVMTSTSSVF